MLHGLELHGHPGALEMLGYEDHKMKPAELHRAISTLVERIELDPLSKEFRMKYRLPLTGVRLASPRDVVSTPPIVWESEAVLRPRWRRAS